MKMKKQCGKQTEENAPRQNFISSIISLQQSTESRYIKQKLAVLDSGKRQIQWIKSIYSHQGSNKKGLRQRLLPGKREGTAKEHRKTSCSTSQAIS